MSYPTNNMAGTEGIGLSICFIILAKAFSFIGTFNFILGSLQILSYAIAIIAASDAMIGSPLRTYLTNLYKERTKKSKK